MMQNISKLTLFIVVLLLPAAALGAPTGVQAIGFANWTTADVDRLAADYKQAGGQLELSFLPFTFNPDHPFDNATRFAQTVLPQAGVTQLKLTPYLWFHNWDPDFQWSAFNAGQERAAFRQTYLRRVAAFDRWAKGLQDWAAQRSLSSKLIVVLCPYLEDDCPSQTAYLNLLTVIRAQQRSDGLASPMRRSAGDHVFRVESLPLELHGRYPDVRTRLRSGDVFSNDGNFVWLDAATIPGSRETANSYAGYGTPTPCGDFIRNQRTALGDGVTVLYWRPAWNALPSSRPPSERHNLRPLTGANGDLENTAVLKVIRSR